MSGIYRISSIRGIVAVWLEDVMPLCLDRCTRRYIYDSLRVWGDQWIRTSVADDVVGGDIGNGTIVGRVSNTVQVTLVNTIDPELLENGMSV